MDANYPMFLASMACERIAGELMKQQHLRPHQSICQALAAVQREVGFCPTASAAAIESLHIDGARKIGRAKRVELSLLARTIGRLWRQNLTSPQHA